MKLSDLIKEKMFDTQEFYYRIIGNDFPLKYKKTGIYLKNIFSIYGYSRELVVDSIKFFNYLSKHNFDFRNFDYFILTAFDPFVSHDYKVLFEYYDIIFVKKHYEPLYNIFDEFRKGLKGENFKLDDTYSDLAYLLLIYAGNRVSIREYYHDNDMERFVNSILKIITILFWINSKKEMDELNTITNQVLLNEDFIDKCIMKGLDINSLSFHQLSYIANKIYNNEFLSLNKKIIK